MMTMAMTTVATTTTNTMAMMMTSEGDGNVQDDGARSKYYARSGIRCNHGEPLCQRPCAREIDIEGSTMGTTEQDLRYAICLGMVRVRARWGRTACERSSRRPPWGSLSTLLGRLGRLGALSGRLEAFLGPEKSRVKPRQAPGEQREGPADLRIWALVPLKIFRSDD